jgi:hypothetical protein
MEFVAVDVETANADVSTICQIGIARCSQESVLDEWKTYVDPEDYFDGINVSMVQDDYGHGGGLRGSANYGLYGCNRDRRAGPDMETWEPGERASSICALQSSVFSSYGLTRN